MANTFKNAFKEACVHTGTGSDVLTCPSSNASKCVLIGLHLTNTTSAEVTATVNIVDASDSSGENPNVITLVNAVKLPANSMLAVLEGDKIILEESDILRVIASGATSVNAFASYLLSDST